MGDEWDRLIKEKDEQITQLMEEGESALLFTQCPFYVFLQSQVHVYMYTCM